MRALLIPAAVMMLMVSIGMSPAVACYAVATFLIIAIYAWSARREHKPALRPGVPS